MKMPFVSSKTDLKQLLFKLFFKQRKSPHRFWDPFRARFSILPDS